MGSGAAPRAGHEGGHHLVDQGLVELRAEGRLGHLDAGRRLLALLVYYGKLHRLSLPQADAGALAAARRTTSPPVGPGTAPFSRMRLRSASTRTTSRF